MKNYENDYFYFLKFTWKTIKASDLFTDPQESPIVLLTAWEFLWPCWESLVLDIYECTMSRVEKNNKTYVLPIKTRKMCETISKIYDFT